jgi:serine/threonine-protein kinase
LKSTAAVQAKINLMVPAAQVIAAALQNYGMILADGGNIAFTFKSDQFSTLKWANYNLDSHAFFETSASSLVPTDFDVINVGAPSTYLDGSSFNCVRTQGIP